MRLIGIAGGFGSGKTIVVEVLKQLCGENMSEIIPLDVCSFRDN